MGGTPHANATHFPNDESLELELGDWIKPSIAEVLDRGGLLSRERKDLSRPIPTRDTADLDTKWRRPQPSP